MQKDVIYIDVEDDITAIISKVKTAKEKVVALVPPKRTGVLQSAVNLRLLARAADGANKHLVIITNNAALSGLAASAKIPVAKNLQSKPEIAAIPVLKVDDDDVIEGDQLPVGDHAGMSEDIPVSGMVPPSTIEDINIDGDTPPVTPNTAASRKAPKKGIKVPDFGTFRKKMFLFAGLGVLLIVFLVWAIWIAPHATVVISAKTTGVDVNTPLTIGDALQTDDSKATLASVTQTEKVSGSIDFIATGTKDIGEKATGTMTLTRSVPGSVTVPYGAGFSSGDCTFTTQAQVVVPGATPGGWNGSGFSTIPGTVDVKVQATAVGDQCNLSARSYDSSVAGISANGAQMSGGSKKTVKIVTTDDLQKARDALASQDINEHKAKLRKKFPIDTIIIDTSFKNDLGDLSVSPNNGQDVPDGKAKLTTEITYSIVGIAKDELDKYLKTAIDEQLQGKEEQRIYDSGASSAKLTDYKQSSDQKTATVQLAATGKIGPKIKDDDIKNQVKGKRSGEVIGDLKAIDGVSDVEVKLSPFWVSGVPDDTKKITIEFKLIKND